ncbi:hypothetical protein [Paenibacillus lautus]|nr:hypothetical protein [Paenibacillus lautus]
MKQKGLSVIFRQSFFMIYPPSLYQGTPQWSVNAISLWAYTSAL